MWSFSLQRLKMPSLSPEDVADMVSHAIETPPNGYLGQDFGSSPRSLLLLAQSAGHADAFIAKLRRDVPVLNMLPPNVVNLHQVRRGVDGSDIVVDVVGKIIGLGQVQ